MPTPNCGVILTYRLMSPWETPLLEQITFFDICTELAKCQLTLRKLQDELRNNPKASRKPAHPRVTLAHSHSVILLLRLSLLCL